MPVDPQLGLKPFDDALEPAGERGIHWVIPVLAGD